ncbi:uncharacterized protein MELLADRAFT_57826, partial [Melampsora larici-populina 98AG31]
MRSISETAEDHIAVDARLVDSEQEESSSMAESVDDLWPSPVPCRMNIEEWEVYMKEAG